MAVVGDKVTYVDPVGVPHEALVTNRFDGKVPDSEEDIDPKFSINVVYVSSDTTETDNYGRQIKRETSVQGKASGVTAHGRHWYE